MHFAGNCKGSECVEPQVEVLLASSALHYSDKTGGDLNKNLFVFRGKGVASRLELHKVVSKDFKHGFENARVYKL